MGDAFPALPLVPGSGAKKRIGGQGNVSDNYRFYSEKMEELRVRRGVNRPLQGNLYELFLFVMECEAKWESRGTKGRDAAPGS
jgi:hypothetical protein